MEDEEEEQAMQPEMVNEEEPTQMMKKSTQFDCLHAHCLLCTSPNQQEQALCSVPLTSQTWKLWPCMLKQAEIGHFTTVYIWPYIGPPEIYANCCIAYVDVYNIYVYSV